MKKNVIKVPNPKGIELPSGNCTLTVIKKVDPETLPKRLRGIYQKLAKGAARLSSVAGDNRHKRWSVRILLKMKLIEAKAEGTPKRKSIPKAAQPKAETL
jgi:predicted transcriptional regulator